MSTFRREPKLGYQKRRVVSPVIQNAVKPEEIDPSQILDSAYANLRLNRPSNDTGAIDDANPQQAADRVFLNLAGVKNKADILLDVLEKNVRKNFIPVYADSSEVIKAVKRQDPQNAPDGSRIFWDLYRRAVFNAFHQFDGITLDVLDNLTGEPFTDAQILENNIQLWKNPQISQVNLDSVTRPNASRSQQVQALMRQRITNEGPSLLERLLVYGGSLVFIWFLQKKLSIFDAPQKAATAAPKFPPGTEIVPMLIQILIGIAVHMMIEGLLKEDTKRAMESFDYPPEVNVDLDDIIGKAQVLIDGGTVDGHTINTYPGMNASAGFLQIALSRLGEGDLDLILSYAIQWLSTHNEEGYDEWIAYMHLYDISDDIQSMLEVAPQYSPVFLEQARKAGKTKIGVPAIRKSQEHYGSRNLTDPPSVQVMTSPQARYSSFAHLTHADSWDDYRKDFMGTIQKDFLDSLQFASCSYNRSVNGFAALLTNNPFIPDMLCCFVRFMGSVDPRVLQSIRSMIALFANGLNFDLGGFLNKIHQRTYGDLMKKIAYELLALVDEVFNNIMDRILDFANSLDERLLICLPIDAMMNLCLKGIEDLKNLFKDLLLSVLDKFQTKGYNFDMKISILQERKWARQLLSIIDAILAALQMGKLCNASEREYTHSSYQFIDDYLKVQDYPEGLYKSLQDVINPTKDGTSAVANVAEMAQVTQAGDATSVKDNIKSNPLQVIDVYGVPLDLDQTIVGRNQFNTFDGSRPMITQNGVDLPAFKDIIVSRTTWDRTVSADQRESCIDKFSNAQLAKYMQMTADLKGL